MNSHSILIGCNNIIYFAIIFVTTITVKHGYAQSNAAMSNAKNNDSSYQLYIGQNPFLYFQQEDIVKKISDDRWIVYVSEEKKNKPEASIHMEDTIPNNRWKLNTDNINAFTDSKESIVIQYRSRSMLPSWVNVQLVSEQALYRIIRLTANKQQFTALLDDPNICYIGKESINTENYLIALDNNHQANKINYVHAYFPQYTGLHELASVKEPMFNIQDIDLADRYTDTGRASEDILNHPTEMAKVMVGNGNSFRLGKGVAFDAKVTSSAFNDLFPDNGSYLNEWAISIQNHSYGTVPEDFYGSMAHAYDKLVHDYPDKLHVFSSGNQGVSENEDNEDFIGFHNLSGNFKQAKNILVVGAVDTLGNLFEYSSRGPAHDGRIKPEIMAYSSMGTSNAAALVSGTAILLSQAFRQLFDSPPSAAFLKALLINSADDLETEGPDHLSGYGQLNAKKAMESLHSYNYISEKIKSGENMYFSVNIPEHAHLLRITLCWTDLPAPVNSSKALMHDLDMRLISPQQDTLYPWVLGDDLRAAAIRSNDNNNNIEQISMKDVPEGDYTIWIKANTLFEQQPFHIVYHWERKDHFQFTAPTYADNAPYDGKTSEYIRWESTYQATSGVLSYRLLSENEWIKIGDTDPKKGQHRWKPPLVNESAQIRMQFDAQTFYSDTFLISYPIQIGSGFLCGDSTLLHWKALETADQYVLYKMQGERMTAFLSQQDTFLVVNTTELQSPHIAVRAITSDGDSLIRSYAANYQNIAANCYINAFFGEVNEANELLLHVHLSSLYQIDALEVKKVVGDMVLPVSRIEKVEGLRISLRDTTPRHGGNMYHLSIKFKHHGMVQTAQTEVYYVAEERGLHFYPNPAHKGGSIILYTTEDDVHDGIVQILSSSGALIREEKLETTPYEVSNLHLSTGLYFIRLLRNGKRYTAKLMIY